MGKKGKESLHLRVEDAGRGLDDAGEAAVDLHLEDLTLAVADDSEELDDDVLGVHVQDKVERERLGLAGGDADVVLDGGQVADDSGGGRSILGQRLGGLETASDECDLNWAILLVLDLDESSCRAAVDELDAKDVGVREDSLDLGLQFNRGRSSGSLGAEAGWLACAGLSCASHGREKGGMRPRGRGDSRRKVNLPLRYRRRQQPAGRGARESTT